MAGRAAGRIRRSNAPRTHGRRTAGTLEIRDVEGRRVGVITFDEWTLSSAGFRAGDRFVLEELEEKISTTEFEFALEAVANHRKTTVGDVRSAYPMVLANRAEGMHAYWQASSMAPRERIATCKHGCVERLDSEYFIYMNPIVWNAGVDVIPTSIHQILHVLQPRDAEEVICGLAQAVCDLLTLVPEGVLGEEG